MPFIAHVAPEDFEFILYRVEDHIAYVTLNRPERRNALNRRMYDELESAFKAAQKDNDVRCVVLTAADPAFCSGDDVKEIMLGEERDQSVARLRSVRPRPTPAAVAVLECDRPVIAAVNGPAVGWGMELALFADIRVASENAKFGEIFIKRGLITDVGGLWRLPALVGPSKAAELVFTGDVIDARMAKDIGLVSDVVPHDDLIEHTVRIAKKIAANAPLALRFMKEGMRKFSYGDLDEIGGWVSATLGTLFETEDHKEGALSFVEKREPVFKGR